MPAKPANLNFGRKTFMAQYAGACATCGSAILPGDLIFYPGANEFVSGAQCCADRPDSELVIAPRTEDIHTGDHGDPEIRIAAVMPRGRTRADMCPACFQIRSSNNACGCHA